MEKRKRKRKKKKILLFIIGSLIMLLGINLLCLFILVRPVAPEITEDIPTLDTKQITEDIPTEASTKPIELTVTQQNKLKGYQKSFATLNQRDMLLYSQSNQSEIEVLKQEVQNLLDNNEITALEEAINRLAYSLDKIDILSGQGELYYVMGVLVVNKQHCLPADFRPGENSLARQAFDQMAADAKAEGINLYDFSTYRNYDVQEGLYNRYVAADGQENADRYSARPGCSEHQTGLVMDIGGDDRSKWAETTFDDTKEAQWLTNNAHRYGYILRYPVGGEQTTGYMHESWHYRYIGQLAELFKESNITILEDYLLS
jgi:LAS superfamily LD-carboxypeptidase LdcB